MRWFIFMISIRQVVHAFGLLGILWGFTIATPSSPSFATESESLESDWNALKKLFELTGGPNWQNRTNWDMASNRVPRAEELDRWYGITVRDGRVSRIELENNNLQGVIPWAIGTLSGLEVLNLGVNQLRGPIQPEIGKLPKLQRLNLALNEFSGSIPAEIGNLGQLEYLNLRSNQLSGPLPQSIGRLNLLSALYLNDNRLSGTIPAEWDGLTNLHSFWISFNPELRGPLPDLIMDRSHPDLSVGVDQTDVCIPPESIFPEDSFPQKQACILNSEWEALIDLYQRTDGRNWDRNSNWQSGTRPSINEVANWEGVEILNGRISGIRLPYNHLQGELSPKFSALTELSVLDLQFNSITGQIPESWSALSRLRELSLDGTQVCYPSRSDLREWFGNVELASELEVCPSRLGSINSTRVREWWWIGLGTLLLVLVAAISVLARRRSGRSNTQSDESSEPADSQEPIEKSLDTLTREIGDTAELLRLNTKSTTDISEYTDSMLRMQRALTEREQENERLKRGYDNKIFRKFVTQFIRVDQAILYFLRTHEGPSSSLESIHRLLQDALADCNVESFTPAVGSDYRHAFGVADQPKVQSTERLEDDYTIAEVVECGYLIRGEEKDEVLIPARVVISRFETTTS